MPDETQGQNIQVEENPQEAMPTSDKPADGGPEMDIKQRTAEEFEKLTETNKRLKAELEEAKKQPTPSVLDSLNPGLNEQPVSQNQQQVVGKRSVFDPNQFGNLNQTQVKDIQEELTYTGADGYKYVDTARLQTELQKANSRADMAARKAEMAAEEFRRYEEGAQVRETYKLHPQLNPNDKSYDPNFYEMVRSELMSQAMKGQKDLLKAAKDVQKRIESFTKKTQGETKDKENEVKKQQINATGNASTANRYSGTEHDVLVSATMRGKPGALAERLRRSGY